MARTEGSGSSYPADVTFIRFMSRHLVALTGEYESLDEQGQVYHRGVFALSGFVVSLHDRWLWVSAGHCFTEVLENRRLRIHGLGLVDYMGPNAVHQHSVPFPYELGDGFHVGREDLSLDFGLVPLSGLVRSALERNSIIAVSRENWIRQHRLDFEHYRMLGLPARPIQDSTRVYPDGRIGADLQPIMLALERLDPNEVEDVAGNTWFVGQIPPEVTVESIVGMSGGPIFGFRRGEDGRWYYHVVALQSWWRPESRIAFGCALPLFAEAVHDAMARPQ